MADINSIREMYFLKGMNKSEIARETGIDRKTIRKYINQDDWNMVPRLKAENSGKFPKLEPFKADIDSWLEEDRRVRRKQRHTAKRVYDRLKEKYPDTFNCSYRTVAGYVAKKKKELKLRSDCKLPLEHIPGEAQVDFGKADFYENGTLYSGAYINLSFPHSNGGYIQLFKGENTECLLEGLKKIFEHIGGVPYRLWFDNASTMVTNILKDGKRELTEAFLRFKQHYGFEAVFCNPASGHEKGHVETKVGYHRRNMLVPVPRFEDLNSFNQELLKKCDENMQREHYRKEKVIAELFEEDKKALLPLPKNPYEVCSYETVKTNTYAKFSLNGGRHIYSTAPKFANSRVLVKITAHEVIVLDENHREIVRHRRLYGNNKQESMNWLPYLTQLSRCPGALKYSGIYKMLPEPLKEYMDRCSRSKRSQTLKILANLTQDSGFEKAVETFHEALKLGVDDMDSIIALHKRLTDITPDIKLNKLPDNLPYLKPYNLDIRSYDRAFLKGGRELC